MKNEIELVNSIQASPAGGHYSHAIKHAGLVYVSGQLGFEPGTNKKEATSFE